MRSPYFRCLALRGILYIGWAMKLRGIVHKIGAAALDTRSAPAMIFHPSVFGYRLCRVMSVMFEVMRTQGERGKEIGESVERFPSAAGSGPMGRR